MNTSFTKMPGPHAHFHRRYWGIIKILIILTHILHIRVKCKILIYCCCLLMEINGPIRNRACGNGGNRVYLPSILWCC